MVAFCGLYLIIVPSQGLGAISWMDLLALFGGLLAGWAILSIKKLHETDTSRAILFSQCFFGLMIVASPAQSGGYSFTMIAWITLFAIGLLATIAQLQMTYAYKFIGATEGSLLCITHDPSFPYGCRAAGFKSRLLPSIEVYVSSGMDCLMFAEKDKTR